MGILHGCSFDAALIHHDLPQELASPNSRFILCCFFLLKLGIVLMVGAFAVHSPRGEIPCPLFKEHNHVSYHPGG